MTELEVKKSLRRLKVQADSDDWSERETAGFALRDLIEREFDPTFDLVEDWVSDSSERIRRAACLACMQRKRFTNDARLKRLLKRLDTIMADDSLYVRKCCGPFVVGYLGYTYPLITIPWLAKKARSTNFNVRANVAKAFTQALGGQYPEDAIGILEGLCKDQVPRVRSAVAAALRNVGRRNTSLLGRVSRLQALMEVEKPNV